MSISLGPLSDSRRSRPTGPTTQNKSSITRALETVETKRVIKQREIRTIRF